MLNNESDFINQISILATKFSIERKLLNTVIQNLSKIEANTNDSLNGILKHIGYSLEDIIDYQCIRSQIAFSVNGFNKQEDRVGLQTLGNAYLLYKNLKLNSKRQDCISITTIG